MIDWDSWSQKPSREMDSEEAYADYARTSYQEGNQKAGEWLDEHGYFDWLNTKENE
jgi:hypothetical protein